jgi:hypothetical protein
MIILVIGADLLQVVKDFPTLAHSILFSVVVVAGCICEGVATFLECRWDRALQRSGAFDVDGDWLAYLRAKDECIGVRYLSRLVTTLYFELCLLMAIPFLSVGLGLLILLHAEDENGFWAAAVVVVGSLVALYLRYQAKSTHQLLCQTRQKLYGVGR